MTGSGATSTTTDASTIGTWERALLGVPVRSVHTLLPGIAAAAAIMLVASWLSGVLGAALLGFQGIDPAGKSSPVSGIIVAILLGIGFTNVVGSFAILKPGLEFSVKKALRLGIILVGLKLSLLDVLQLGVWGIPVVAVVIGTALLLTAWLARRLGVSDRLGTLTAAAVGICGVTATVATAAAIDADDREVAYTVANVTLFGILAMFLYPYLAHALFADAPGSAGLFLGTSIHETAQVMGAALTYREVFGDEAAFKVATITKLTRNVFLVAVVPVLGFLYARKQGGQGAKVSLAKLFPVFVLGFLAMALVRSLGDAGLDGGRGLAFGALDASTWSRITKLLGEKAAYFALGTAMAGVGLTTDLKLFKGLGLRPVYLGALVSALVGSLGLALAAVFGRFIAP